MSDEGNPVVIVTIRLLDFSLGKFVFHNPTESISEHSHLTVNTTISYEILRNLEKMHFACHLMIISLSMTFSKIYNELLKWLLTPFKTVVELLRTSNNHYKS